MFGGNHNKQYQQDLRNIRDELGEIYSQLGHRVFNKLSKDEGVALYYKAEKQYLVWHEKLRTEDWRIQSKVLKKYRRDLEKTEILIEKIRLRLRKKGVSLSVMSQGVSDSAPPVESQQHVAQQESMAETFPVILEPEEPQQSTRRPPDKASDPVGYIRGLQVREEMKRTVDGILRMVSFTPNVRGFANHKIRHVWSFSLDVCDKDGYLWYSVPVIIRGNKVKGGFAEGDLVKVYGQYEAGQVLETNRLYNETTRTQVRVSNIWQRM